MESQPKLMLQKGTDNASRVMSYTASTKGLSFHSLQKLALALKAKYKFL